MQTMMTMLVGLASATFNTPASEELPVERAARQYRIHVYDTYRTERETYDRFREAGDELLDSWRAAGEPQDHRQQVLGWYQEASSGTLAISLPPLPDLPADAAPAPEATVDAEPSGSLEEEPTSTWQTVTPLPIDSSDGLPESSDGADGASEALRTSTSAAPAADRGISLAEKWSGAPQSIATIGQFMFGLAGH